jgi:hypothetical protein
MATSATSTRSFRLGISMALLGLLCFNAPADAAIKRGLDRLKNALDLLNQAKESSSPTPFLYQAKDEVEQTLLPHRDAEKKKSVDAISEAITASTTHTKEKEAIQHAIESVRKLAGMDNGGGKKKKKK